MAVTAYTILGVEADATHEEIAAAFRAKSIEWHPDRAKDETDRAVRTGRMAKLTLAWRYVGDPDARAKYDQKLTDLAAKDQPVRASDDNDTVTIDALLQRLKTGNAGDLVSAFAAQAGLADAAGLGRIQAASAKGAEVAKSVVDLIGIVRGR